MLVSELISLARSSELNGLSEVNMTTEKMLGFVNLGIIELSKKFNMVTKVEVIRTSPYTNVYSLRNTDVVQILEIFDSNGKELIRYTTIDGENYDYRLVGFNTFLLKREEQYVTEYDENTGIDIMDEVSSPDKELAVVYRGIADKVTSVLEEVPISDVFMDALLSYIGYKANSAVATNEFETTRLWNRYMNSINEITLAGFDAFTDIPSRSVASRGFI